MHAWGPIVLYVMVVAASGFAVMPLCRAAFGDVSRIPLVSISLTVGFPLVLLLLSLVARVAPVYGIAVPLTILVVAVLRTWGHSRAAAWDGRGDAVLLGTYAVLLCALLYLRAGWPSIYWDNDFAHAGTEKLFNFSLIQAFLFGRGYPPENLWLAGEPLDYYVLLHALPGMVAWAWRAVTGDAAAGGVLFVFSDVFLLLLGSFALSAWTQALLASGSSGLTRRQVAVVGLGLGLGVLVSTHAKAVWLVLASFAGGTGPAWLELEREVVPYTYSQYPMYLLLQGDHHAFQRVFFLQVALYGVVALLATTSRLHWPRVLLAGGLAAAVRLSHSGSVLLDLIVFGLAAAGIAGVRLWRGEGALLRPLIANLGAAAAIALVLSLPYLWGRQSPRATWYWVETTLASTLPGFLAAQAGPLAFFAAACAAGLLASRIHGLNRTLLPWRRGIACLVVAAGGLMVVARPGAAVAVTCALLVLMLAPGRSTSGEDRAPLVILAAAVFGAWLLPEFAVVDLANRPVVEWKRWNLAMRFWLEAYYLVPFLAVLAFGPMLRPALDNRAFVRVLAAAMAVVGGLWITVHAYAIADRRARTPDRPGLDGAAFLARQHPCDAAIVEHLRGLTGPVRIGELCGTGQVIHGIPLDYGWAGRIAAFSGRPGICGWSRHVWQFSPKLRRDTTTRPWTWERTRAYEASMAWALDDARNGASAPTSRALLDSLGVTHVVLGEQERRLFPGVSGRRLAAALGGSVEFERGADCAVIRLATPPADHAAQ